MIAKHVCRHVLVSCLVSFALWNVAHCDVDLRLQRMDLRLQRMELRLQRMEKGGNRLPFKTFSAYALSGITRNI